MKYEFHEPGDYGGTSSADELRYDDRRRPGEDAMQFVSNGLVPALFGALGGFLLVVLIPDLVYEFSQGSGSAERIVTRVLDRLSQDINAFTGGDFMNNVRLWFGPMLGFLIVAFVKVLGSDKKYR